MEDLISVLMCVYNTPKQYLEEAVNSILSQSYQNLEFIIVDDGSDDMAIQEYLNELPNMDSRVAIYRNQSNIGLTKSLNIGLSYCRGKYIARMDSDDVAYSHRIKTQTQYLDIHLEVALVGCQVTVLANGKEMIGADSAKRRTDDYEIYIIRSLFQHSGPAHPTFMFRACFLQDHHIRYREEIKKAQDYGIMVDILKEGGTIKTIQEPLLQYRLHEGQITTKSEIEQKVYQSKVSFDYLKELFPELDDSECAAISLLGNEMNLEDMIQIVEKKDELGNVAKHITDNKDVLKQSQVYIAAVRKMLKLNIDRKHYYDEKQLEAELRYELWKKVLRTSRQKRRLWGLCPYTINCYRYVCLKKTRNNE